MMYKINCSIKHPPFRGQIRDKSSQSTSDQFGTGAKCDEQAFALILTPRLSAFLIISHCANNVNLCKNPPRFALGGWF